MKNNNQKILVLLGGPSCAGKSTVCKSLSQKYQVTHLNMDWYFVDSPIRTDDGIANWDDPTSIDWGALLQAVINLMSGKDIVVPSSDLTNYETISLKPRDIIIVEGFLAAYNSELQSLAKHIIYLDVSESDLITRRLPRQDGYHDTYVTNVVIPYLRKYKEQLVNNSTVVISKDLTPENVELEILKIIF